MVDDLDEVMKQRRPVVAGARFGRMARADSACDNCRANSACRKRVPGMRQAAASPFCEDQKPGVFIGGSVRR
jgi:hypothetical protein